jgi:hypothetical protein
MVDVCARPGTWAYVLIIGRICPILVGAGRSPLVAVGEIRVDKPLTRFVCRTHQRRRTTDGTARRPSSPVLRIVRVHDDKTREAGVSVVPRRRRCLHWRPDRARSAPRCGCRCDASHAPDMAAPRRLRRAPNRRPKPHDDQTRHSEFITQPRAARYWRNVETRTSSECSSLEIAPCVIPRWPASSAWLIASLWRSSYSPISSSVSARRPASRSDAPGLATTASRSSENLVRAIRSMLPHRAPAGPPAPIRAQGEHPLLIDDPSSSQARTSPSNSNSGALSIGSVGRRSPVS